MILILVNIRTRNNCTKRHHQQQQSSSITQNGQYLEILKVPDQTYPTISVVVIFKSV